ncbi:hypothetical protein D3C75_1098450 [compost metagenome]
MVGRSMTLPDAQLITDGAGNKRLGRSDRLLQAVPLGQSRCRRRGEGAARPMGMPGLVPDPFQQEKIIPVIQHIHRRPFHVAALDYSCTGSVFLHNLPGGQLHILQSADFLSGEHLGFRHVGRNKRGYGKQHPADDGFGLLRQ